MKLSQSIRLAALTLATACLVTAAPFTQPRPGSSIPAEAALISGDTAIKDGVLTITIRSDAAPITEWIHVFLSLGGSQPYYNHNTQLPRGRQLNILLEGNLAYRFNSDDPTIWSWTQFDGVTIERQITGNTLTLRVPMAALGLQPDKSVKIFAASYTPDYTDPLDAIPRETTIWQTSR